MPETTNFQSTAWCHALSRASCAITYDSPLCLFLGTAEREGWGRFTMCLRDVGGAWEAAEVGRIERISYSAGLLTRLHRCDESTMPV